MATVMASVVSPMAMVAFGWLVVVRVALAAAGAIVRALAHIRVGPTCSGHTAALHAWHHEVWVVHWGHLRSLLGTLGNHTRLTSMHAGHLLLTEELRLLLLLR